MHIFKQIGSWLMSKLAGIVYCAGFSIILTLATLQTSSAQQINVNDLLVQPNVNCQDAAQNFTRRIPALHQANETDSLYAIIAFWEEYCGLPEPLIRFHVLHQIEINVFSEHWLPENIMDILQDYRKISEWEDPNFYLDYFYNQYIPTDSSYITFTRNLAGHLQRYADLKPIELFFLDFYSHNFDQALKRLSSGELAGTKLDSVYKAQLERVRKAPKPFFSFYAGLWKPNGSLALLGNHPQVGMSYGVVQQRLFYELIFKIGFLSSPNYYEVVVDNIGYRTKNFTNLHLSGRIGLAAIKSKWLQLLLSLGIGYEGIEAFSSSEQEEYGLSRMISSASFSPGAEFRFPVSKTSFLGLNIRYNFLSFVTKRNETPLKGNALLFGISYGFLNP